MRKQFFLFARTSSLKQTETGARELRRSPSTFDSLLSRASLSLLPSQRPATLPTPPYFASPAPFSAFPSSSTSSTSSPGRILARRRCQTLAQASLLPSPFEERALALPFFPFGPLPLPLLLLQDSLRLFLDWNWIHPLCSALPSRTSLTRESVSP